MSTSRPPTDSPLQPHPGRLGRALPERDGRDRATAGDQRSPALFDRPPGRGQRPEHYRALALAVRDRMQDRRVVSTQTSLDLGRKVTCYLSAEFLMGPQLGNNLLNLGMERAARDALAAMGQNLDTVLACEEEPGLGNGGLGRLAACYLDSLATLERPAIGYGIRYEFGIFDQEIHDGWQVEQTDNWLDHGNPWEIAKPDVNYLVKWGGYAAHYTDDAGHDRVRWVPGGC